MRDDPDVLPSSQQLYPMVAAVGNVGEWLDRKVHGRFAVYMTRFRYARTSAAVMLTGAALLLAPVGPAAAAPSHTPERPGVSAQQRHQVIPFTSATLEQAQGDHRWTVR